MHAEHTLGNFMLHKYKQECKKTLPSGCRLSSTVRLFMGHLLGTATYGGQGFPTCSQHVPSSPNLSRALKSDDMGCFDYFLLHQNTASALC